MLTWPIICCWPPWACPGTPELGDEAVRYGVLAAEEATARLAYEDAVGHIQRQLDGLGPAGLLRESARLELLLCRADALRCAGQQRPRRRTTARRSSSPVAPTADTAGTGRARGSRARGGVGFVSGSLRQLLEEALDRLPDEDSGLKARVLASLARELFLSGCRSAPGPPGSAPERSRPPAGSVTTPRSRCACWPATTPSGCPAWPLDGGRSRSRWAPSPDGRATELRSGGLSAAGVGRAGVGRPDCVVDLDEFPAGHGGGPAALHYLVLTRQAALATMTGQFADAERLIAEAAAWPRRSASQTPGTCRPACCGSCELPRAGGRGGGTASHRAVSHLSHWFDAMLGLVLLERGERAEAMRLIGTAVQARPEDLASNYVMLSGPSWAKPPPRRVFRRRVSVTTTRCGPTLAQPW